MAYLKKFTDLFGNKNPASERLRSAHKEIADLKYRLSVAVGQIEDESGVLVLVAQQRDELFKLVKAVAKSQTLEEAWEASEHCYDYLSKEGFL